MSPTDNKTVDTAVEKVADRRGLGPELYLIIGAMLTYAVLLGLVVGSVGGAPGVIASTVAYLVSIYLYYGIARLAFREHNYVLWGGAIAAVVVSYSLAGSAGLWFVLSAWSLVLFAGAVVGRLSFIGQNQQRVYVAGLLVVLGFAVAQHAPQWKMWMSVGSEFVDDSVEYFSQQAIALGYGADAIKQDMELMRRVMKASLRLIPSVTVLSAVLPFSIGYLAFSYRLDAKRYSGRAMRPYEFWKMPFGVLPVLCAAMLVRLLGTPTLILAADNVLAFLAFFYLVTGLALIEYYLRRYLPPFLRILFYITFFLSQFAGFYVAAAMLLSVVFLGFIDSFLDWRKVRQLSLDTK
ncbi:MAG: DUF2232 domain-containing protein [candidate division Zixibacteria bacterium]